jgi:hypothetical protein
VVTDHHVGAVGLFYGAFGVARLGVRLDIALAAGALCLIALAVSPRRRWP